VEADETAQHMKRILWMFGNVKKDPHLSVTTRVHYGDGGFIARLQRGLEGDGRRGGPFPNRCMGPCPTVYRVCSNSVQ
jgi:hypothetical protein